MIGPGRLAQRFEANGFSRAFAEACRSAVAPGHATWVGLEHEFLVFDARGTRADFRSVIHGLGLGRPDLVPGDRHAYRLPSGSLVTSDTTEAEIATPPVDLRPGFTARLDAWAAYERTALADRAPSLTLRGDSTHLNVMLPGDIDADRVASLFATRFAPGLMLLMDRRTSPGLLVRPRPYRLELGGEYVVGDALRAALAYAVGATLACVAWLRRPRSIELPSALDVRMQRGVLRYGWYIDRRAFGEDLYSAGRSASLVSADGERLVAQRHLENGWAAARRHLEPVAARRDLVDADALVAGRAQLPSERATSHHETDVARPRRPRSPFGTATRPVRRPGYDIAPVMLTWQSAVFLAAQPDRRRAAFVAVPGTQLGGFARRLNSGLLDEALSAYLGRAPTGRRLREIGQLVQAGLYDELGLRSALLAPERDYSGRPIRYRMPGHRIAASVE